MKLAMAFPGQGSQSAGMLNGYGDLPVIRAVLAEASDVLGQDIAKLVAEGPAEELNKTVNTQPVMVTAGYAAYRAWQELGGQQPAMVAGHSLGEYTALVVAGSISFAQALPLVREARNQFPLSRALAMQYADALMAAGRKDEATTFLRDQAHFMRHPQQVDVVGEAVAEVGVGVDVGVVVARAMLKSSQMKAEP